MSNISVITIFALIASVVSEPLLFSAPLIAAPPFASAALVAPGAAQVVAAPVAPAVPGTVPAAVPAAVPATVPFSSVSAYSYGSSYSIQDYVPVVNSAAYSLPYAYAADWFYRR